LSELIYGGLWFTPLREALCAFVDSTQQTVSGKVRLKLYKGSINAAGVTSANSLYNTSLASFTTGELFNHADAKGFIKLYGLPVLVRSLMEQGKKDGAKATSGVKASSASSGRASARKGRTASGRRTAARKK
jgi:argininosuccinate synthase